MKKFSISLLVLSAPLLLTLLTIPAYAFQEHMFHIGFMFMLTVVLGIFYWKDTAVSVHKPVVFVESPLRKFFLFLTIFAFLSLHVFPSHVLAHGATGNGHATNDHPCCMPVTPSPTLFITILAISFVMLPQKPFRAVVSFAPNNLTDRSPPTV